MFVLSTRVVYLGSPVFLGAAVTMFILVYWLYWRSSRRRLLELASKVPGPPSLPLLGNTWVFLSRPEELLNILAGFVFKYGEYVKFWLGPDFNIIVRNPADIRLLLTSNKVNNKGPSYEMMKKFIGPGILTGGAEWRNHRKIATPSYNKKAVAFYSTVFNEEARAFVKVLAAKEAGKTFNVFYDVLETTTQSVCQTLMGLSKEDSTNIYRLRDIMLETQKYTLYNFMFSKITKWWYQVPLIYILIGAKKKDNFYLKLIDDVASDIVNKRRKYIELNNIDNEDSKDIVMGVVDRYILCGELKEHEIKWETFSLFTTSQEASAKIASAVLLFLAHLQDWQEKVYNEIIEVLGVHDAFVTDDDLKKLKYLDMVYKEVLRYLSIAAMIQRTVEEEIAIDNGNIILPVGTSVIIPIHHLHRDKRYWEKPNKVMPERFLPENCKNRDPNAFVPFSLGAMDCLGRVYATSLIKTLVVKAVRHVKFEADGKLEDLDLHFAISVKFAKGYNLRVLPRMSIN